MFKRLQRSDYEMILAMIIFGTLAPFVRNVATSSATIAFQEPCWELSYCKLCSFLNDRRIL